MAMKGTMELCNLSKAPMEIYSQGTSQNFNPSVYMLFNGRYSKDISRLGDLLFIILMNSLFFQIVEHKM